MNICLRDTLKDDLDFVLAAEQDKENRSFISQWSREQHEATLLNQDASHLIIERINDTMPVGYAILLGLKNPHQTIGLQRLVITDKGKGYGKDALRLLKKLAFKELNAHRFWLDVKDFNLRARHLYEAQDFVMEGVLRECIKAENSFESLVVMSILRTEYQEN
ncbi:MAG: GNAT family N-acetyltransferase [Microcoleus sp. SIO2G3]|nr:GNAT family N-acetyltransferase [Microcoleus sp. SIO2G3]